MNFPEITHRYYSCWLGVPPEIMTQPGIVFSVSPERDICQIGYSNAFAIYAYITDSLLIVSYSPQLGEKIELLKNKLYPGMKPDAVEAELALISSKPIQHSIKFCFHQVPVGIDTSVVRKLTSGDYPYFLSFYRSRYPGVANLDWTADYFEEITAKECCFGVFENDQLVSATDTPSMPYLPEQVQEIGINTLPQYRGKGYARAVTLCCIKALLVKNKCPLWSCAASNNASEGLAYAVGFRKLADVVTASI
jgi:hypothetical protein